MSVVPERVGIADRHAQFRLSVLIVNRAAELFLEPADDFRIERLAHAVGNPQLPPDLAGRFGARSE